MTDGSKRRLLWHGAFLFLLGLLTGLVIPSFTIPRMGLAAHLEGVMNGTFLIAVGAVWSEVTLGTRARKIAFGLFLYGTYANWAFTSLAAILGTTALSPIAAGIHRGEQWQEMLVTTGFVSVGVTMIAATIMLLQGLRGRSAP